MYVCRGFQDSLMMSTNLDDIAVLNINGANYGCIISAISKSKEKTLLQSIDLSKKVGQHRL